MDTSIRAAARLMMKKKLGCLPCVRGRNTDLRSASRVRIGPIGSSVHFHCQATAEIGGLGHFSFN
jgi:hypothetical protein